jgi:hypothetical protein
MEGFILGIVMVWSQATLPQCAYEDGAASTGKACYWDASEEGNGKGWSFTSLPNGSYIYWDKDAPNRG